MYIYYLSFLFIFSQNNIYTNNSIEKRCKKNSLIFLHLRIFIISIKLCLNCLCVFPLFYLQIYASMPASSSIFFLNPWLKIAITRPTPITATTVPSPIPIRCPWQTSPTVIVIQMLKRSKQFLVNPTLLCTVSVIACIASGKLIWVCLPKYQNHCRKQIQKPCENKT